MRPLLIGLVLGHALAAACLASDADRRGRLRVAVSWGHRSAAGTPFHVGLGTTQAEGDSAAATVRA